MTDAARYGWMWRALGAAGIGFYAAHAVHYLLRRQAENLLWVCHLGTLGIGVGLMARLAILNAVGTLWLIVGLPLWLYDLRAGGEVLLTSLLAHVGGLILGFLGLKKLGLPAGVWWKSMAALVPICVLSRLLTPPEANVNLSHHVYPGFESVFTVYPIYAGALLLLYAGAGVLFQLGLRKLGFGPPEKP